MQRKPRLPRVAAASTVILGMLIGLGASAAAPAAPAKAHVGVCTAVSASATGTPAGDNPRPLVIGQEVLLSERIVTGPDSHMLIRFVDQSILTVGPSSEVVVDKFAFDPQTGIGELELSAVRGVLRYAGGKISKAPNAVSIRTPVGKIGVHDGVFLMTLSPSGGMNVISFDGEGPTVAGRSGVPQTLSHPVNIVTVAKPGATASVPVPLSAETWTRLVAQADQFATQAGRITQADASKR
jgi:hypothetical protein